MIPLLDLAIRAAGGMDRFNSFRTLTARLHHTGVLWTLKQRDGVLTDAKVTVALHEERVSHGPFLPSPNHSVFTPGRVELRGPDDRLVEALDEPRRSFEGFALETPWTNPQLAYFAGYTMWTYLTSPFVLARPGVLVEELEPWTVDGLVWRRLRAVFPDDIATHSRVQTYYFDADGLLRRHDYEVDIQGKNAAARYLHDYVNVQGILLPSRLRIHPRTAENLAAPEPLIVGVDLSDFAFT
ncbi:hypothetical protein [Luteibacter aegosomatissinici]|uniref:hypothetical protein n=1 Tax=Luteibacter aegosomatissinici TaxID=2911539 RepID=UPI001FF9F575|nr:hypothetical protein [Luteibacter aegosomatissinici]UPG92562.1 hypothetical protein L2Y97_11845 [Luteibacter aegosomatissinici]